MQRLGSAGQMLSETASVVAPAMVANRAAMPAAQAIQESLLGASMAADDVGRRFVERMNQPGPVPTMYSSPVGRAADDAPKGILAYHGSPHDFDRFSMSKIGTGEGAQAYGHGLYFASEADVARGYRRRLENATVKGRPVYKLYDSISSRADRLPPKAAEAEYNKMAVLEDLMNDGDVLAVRERASSGAYDQDAMDWFEKEIAPNFKGSGSLYEVNIRANPEDFLDWDKPLANSPTMKKAILNAIEQARLNGGGEGFDRGLDLFEGDIDGYTQGSAYRRLGDILDPVTGKEDVAASEALRGQGVAGIRYLDAMSRGAGEGSRNYVVFDENLIEIVRKYGIAGAALMLGMSQADLAQAMQAQQQQQPQGLLGGPQ
jgi:hypothetical protein